MIPPEKWKGSFAEKQVIQEMGLTLEENGLGARNHFERSLEKDTDDMIIVYADIRGGGQLYYNKPGSRWTKTYTRRKFKIPKIGKNGKPIKYLTETGDKARPYFNGIIEYFPHENIEHLIIVEGEKKAFVSSKHGMPAVGIQGIHSGAIITHKDEEGNVISAEFHEDLLYLIGTRNVKKITLIHDQDAPNNAGREERAFQFLAAEKYFRWACVKARVIGYYKYITDLATGKGLDDMIRYYRNSRLDEIKDAIYSEYDTFFFKHFNAGAYDEIRNHLLHSHNNPKLEPDEVWHVKRFASEKKEEFLKAADEHHNLFIGMRTGGGKTDLGALFIDHINKKKTSKGRSFFAYPTNIAGEQKYEEYSKPENNYHGISLDQLVYNQYTDQIEMQMIRHYRHFICHPSRLEEFAPDENDTILNDESHKHVIDSFENTLDSANLIYNSPAKKLFFTGTPFRLVNKVMGIHEIEIKQEREQKVKVHFREIAEKDNRNFNIEGQLDIYTAAAEQYINHLVPVGSDKIYTVFLPSKERINALKGMLDPEKYDVEAIYSEDDIRANSKAWRALRSGVNGKPAGYIPTNGKPLILLCTPVLYEAVRIKNTNMGPIAIFGELWPENIIQAAGRAADPEEVELFVFLTTRDKHREGFHQSYEFFKQSYVKEYELLKPIYDQYQKLIDSKIDPLLYGKRKQSLIDAKAIINEDGSFNEFEVVRQYLRTKNAKESNLQKAQRLNEVFDVQSFRLWEVKASEQVEEAITAIKERREDSKDLAAEKVQESPIMALNLLAAMRGKNDLKEEAKEALGGMHIQDIENHPEYQQWAGNMSETDKKYIRKLATKYVKLSQDFDPDPEQFVKVIQEKKNAFGNIQKALYILDLLETKPQHVYQHIDLHFLLECRSKFKKGMRYLSEQIEDIVKEVFEDHKSLKIPTSNGVQLFKILFNHKEGRKGKRYYTIKGYNTKQSFAKSLGLKLKKVDTCSVNINTKNNRLPIQKRRTLKEMFEDHSPSNQSQKVDTCSVNIDTKNSRLPVYDDYVQSDALTSFVSTLISNKKANG